MISNSRYNKKEFYHFDGKFIKNKSFYKGRKHIRKDKGLGEEIGQYIFDHSFNIINVIKSRS